MTTHPGAVALLSTTNQPLGTIDFPKAVRMMFRKVVDVVEGDDTRRIGPHPWPKVLRLLRTVVDTWMDRPARWHRGGVFIRDGHRCAYCGSKADTIDHILPQSRGGLWSWENCVAACRTCNSVMKRNRTPEEAGMPLLFATPYVPTARELRDKARA